MTKQERESLNALSASIKHFAWGRSKTSRDYLDIAAMAAGQFLQARACAPRSLRPPKDDAQYWLQLARIEARALSD